MIEGEIRVVKFDNVKYYTAYVRKVYFLFRGRWKPVIPMMTPDFDEAEQMMRDNL